MGRTERQRKVIQLIVQKAKKAGLSTIFDIMDQVFPMVETSVSKTEILQLLPAMIGYSLNETTGFPSSFKFARVNKEMCIRDSIDCDLYYIENWSIGFDIKILFLTIFKGFINKNAY